MKLPKTLIINPRSGIGDMVWVLPHIRAISREVEQGPIYLLTKSKAQAKTWLDLEPSIAIIDYFDRCDNPFAKGLSLRKFKFTSAWIFHDSFAHALIPYIAGIPKRTGLGSFLQNFLLTEKNLPTIHHQELFIKQMDLLLKQNGLKIQEEDYSLVVNENARNDVLQMYGHTQRPWITMGIRATEDKRIWPAENFIQTAILLNRMLPATFFICGSASEASDVNHVTAELKRKGVEAVAIHHLDLPQTIALLSEADFFIGNDSGLMNVSACVATPSVGLFGGSPVLDYSSNILAIEPQGYAAESTGGMEAILPEQVVAFCVQQGLIHSQG